MQNGQSNQSVKDILEDIKRAISANSGKTEAEHENKDDILHLDEEYLEEEREVNKDDYEESYSDTSKTFMEESIEEAITDGIDYSRNKVHEVESENLENKGNLIFKENIQEIKTLLENMQDKLHHQQREQNDSNLTINELIVSLLKPELSEWLNKHLCKLVKEIVEKEIKNIINNNL